MKYAAPKKAAQCASDILKWAIKHDMWHSCGLYVNGDFYCAYKADPGMELVYEKQDELGDWQRVYKSKRDVERYLEYCNHNGHFISMFFDGGPIYDALNFTGDFMDWCERREAELCDIFEKYGYYYELGHAWNLSAYKI